MASRSIWGSSLYPTLSNVIFFVEDRRFYAHRTFLLASSDACPAMFYGDLREDNHYLADCTRLVPVTTAQICTQNKTILSVEDIIALIGDKCDGVIGQIVHADSSHVEQVKKVNPIWWSGMRAKELSKGDVVQSS